MAKNKIASAVIATAVATVSSPGAKAAAPIIASSDTEGAQAAAAPVAEQSTGGSAADATAQPAPSAKATPIQKAAQFVGVPVDQVLDFKQYGDRYVVVTTSGRKFSRTPAEREADARAAAVAAAQKAAAKAAK